MYIISILYNEIVSTGIIFNIYPLKQNNEIDNTWPTMDYI